MNNVERARGNLAQVNSMLEVARGNIEAVQTLLDSEEERVRAGEEPKIPEWFRPYVTPILTTIIPVIEQEIVKKEAILNQLEARAARNRGNQNYSATNANAVIPNLNSNFLDLLDRLEVCAHFAEMVETDEYDETTYFSRDNLIEKVQSGNHSEVSFILMDENVETSHRDFEFRDTAIGTAIFNNDTGMANILMADSRSQDDLEYFDFRAIDEIVDADDDTEALQLLLSFPQITEINPNSVLNAVSNNKVDFLRILLADPRFRLDDDDGYHINYYLQIAVSEGFTECVRILLADPRGQPTQIQASLFQTACFRGDLPTLRALRMKLDPSLDDNDALHAAIFRGRLEIVNELLKDRRVIDAGLKTALTKAIARATQMPDNAAYKEIVKALKSMCPSNTCSIMGGRRKTKRHRKTRKRKFH